MPFTQHLSIISQRRIEEDFLIEEDSQQTIARTLNPVVAAAAKSFQSCLTLSDTIDGSPPGSPVPGILQARTLEWVAIAFSNA